jgi:hypothetical protein
VTAKLPAAHRSITGTWHGAPMSEEALTRLEAMLLSLRDQVDSLSDRVESRLADQQLMLTRLRLDLARVTPTPAGDKGAHAHLARAAAPPR